MPVLCKKFIFILSIIVVPLSLLWGSDNVEQINSKRLLYSAQFDNTFNTSEWSQGWGVAWTNRTNECEIIEVNDTQYALRVKFPRGAVGPSKGGAQFPMVFSKIEKLKNKPGFDSLTLKYRLKFEEGFDFRMGGKLPGLMGGGDSWARSGGIQPDGSNGWTLRFMWRQNGRLVVYAYLPVSENGKWGGRQWGHDIDCKIEMQPGQWYTIEQFVSVGNEEKDDGKLIVKVDGVELLNISDLNFGKIDNEFHKIGGVFFSTFHGGNSQDWAPLHDSYIQFANFEIFE